jgi:hypothetical protein
MDPTVSASPSSAAMQAKKVSPAPALVAGKVSVVNTTTAGDQALKSIGATSDGGYVVAWTSSGGQVPSLFIQAYDSDGARSGAETRIPLDVGVPTAAAAALAIQRASVAVLTDGTVVVVYQVTRSIPVTGGVDIVSGVFFQRFDANGVQLTPETEVFSEREAGPRSPFIHLALATALSDGGFVVTWGVANLSPLGIAVSTLNLQWFDSQGQPVGSAVNAGVFPLLLYQIAADTQGGGVTVTISRLDNSEVTAIHFDASHAAQTIVAPRFPPISLLSLSVQGGYLLFSSSAAGVTQQRLDSQGNPIGSPTAIPSMPANARELADGTYVLVWLTPSGYSAQRYAMDGTPMGEPVPIDSNSSAPAIVPLADTGFAAAWTGPGANGDTDVFTQRFIEKFSDRKKACQNSAKDLKLKGQERKAFIDACLA